MRILFVAPGLPVPTSGGRSRLHYLARSLAERHDVTILSFVQPSERELVARARGCCRRLELVPIGAYVPLGPWENRLRGWARILFDSRPGYLRTFPVDMMREPLRRLLDAQSFDVVVLEHLSVVVLADEVGRTPIVLAEHNIESDIAHQAFLLARNPAHRLRDWLIWRRLLTFERHWLRQLRVVVTVTDQDAARLKVMSPTTQVRVVPNGVDVPGFAQPGLARKAETLLFFGTLSYGPNRDGLAWFCRDVWPKIRRARPDTELEVAGLNPPDGLKGLQETPGVRLLGLVPDIREVLWRATVAVVPLRIGGGSRLKVLEALAAGLPVVSTSLGAEGLDLIRGQHLLVADDPESFAGSVLAYLASDESRRRAAEAGRRAVANRYDWSTIALQLEGACADAVRLARGES